MRRFSAVVCTLVLVGLAGVLGTNWVVDPRDEHPGESFRPLRRDVLDEKMALYSDRVPPPTVVLGSSRPMVMAVGPDGFNFALPQGRAYDAHLLWMEMERRGPTPAQVLLALDVSLIEDGPLTFYEDSDASARLEGGGVPWGLHARSMMESLNLEYELEALSVLKMTFVSGYPLPHEVYGHDGVVEYVRDDAARAAGTFDLAGILPDHFRQAVMSHYKPGSYADPEKIAILEGLVDQMVSSGAQVRIVLPPFHPYALERLTVNPVFQQQQAAQLDLALSWCSRGVEVYDHTDIASFNGTAESFYDNYHYGTENARRMAAAMDRGEGDLCAAAP